MTSTRQWTKTTGKEQIDWIGRYKTDPFAHQAEYVGLADFSTNTPHLLGEAAIALRKIYDELTPAAASGTLKLTDTLTSIKDSFAERLLRDQLDVKIETLRQSEEDPEYTQILQDFFETNLRRKAAFTDAALGELLEKAEGIIFQSYKETRDLIAQHVQNRGTADLPSHGG